MAKTNRPDAWMELVLKSMSIAELKAEILAGDKSADELNWLKAELQKRGGR